MRGARDEGRSRSHGPPGGEKLGRGGQRRLDGGGGFLQVQGRLAVGRDVEQEALRGEGALHVPTGRPAGCTTTAPSSPRRTCSWDTLWEWYQYVPAWRTASEEILSAIRG